MVPEVQYYVRNVTEWKINTRMHLYFFSQLSYQKATMLMLAGIVVLHITTIILLLVATIDNVSYNYFCIYIYAYDPVGHYNETLS